MTVEGRAVENIVAAVCTIPLIIGINDANIPDIKVIPVPLPTVEVQLIIPLNPVIPFIGAVVKVARIPQKVIPGVIAIGTIEDTQGAQA